MRHIRLAEANRPAIVRTSTRRDAYVLNNMLPQAKADIWEAGAGPYESTSGKHPKPARVRTMSWEVAGALGGRPAPVQKSSA